MKSCYFLAVAVLFLGLAGCGEKTEVETVGVIESTEEAVKEQEWGGSIEVGEGRRKIMAANEYLNAEFYTSEDGRPEDDVELAKWERLKHIESEYDVWIESVYVADKEEFEEFDICYINSATAVAQAYAGLCTDLSSLMKGQTVFKAVNLPGLDGVYLFRPNVESEKKLVYNKTLLDNYELEDPQELLAKGQWTWETWRQQLQMVTRDLDGDRRTDLYGFGGDEAALFSGLLRSNSASVAVDFEEGLSSASTLAVLNFIETIYQADKSAVPSSDAAYVYYDKIAMGGAAFFPENERFYRRVANYGYEYGFVPFPQGPSFREDVQYYDISFDELYFIPKSVSEPELIFDIFSQLCSDDRNIPQNSTEDIVEFWGSVNDFNFSVQSIAYGDRDIASFVEKYSSAFQFKLSQIRAYSQALK